MAKLKVKSGEAAASGEINALLLPDMQVYSVVEGAAVGRVKEVIIDPDEKRLLALAVDMGGWYHDVRIIPSGKISTVGDDIIMIDEKQAAVPAPNLPKIVAQMKNPCNIVGAKVISEDGSLLGKVEGFYLERTGGAISRVELSCGLWGRLWGGKSGLSAEHILTLGSEAVVVDKAAAADLQVKIGLLRSNIRAVAELAGQSAENMGGVRRKTQERLREIAEAKRAKMTAEATEVIEAVN